MRVGATILAICVVASGCGTQSYRVTSSELARLSQVPQADRGRRVRVVQQLSEADMAPAPAVSDSTTIIFVPDIEFDMRVRSGPGYGGGRGLGGGGGGIKLGGGGAANDSKAQAVVFVALAVVALVAVAGIEGSRFDGYAQLHPMYPVHLFGRDGGYTVVPLAWVDANAARWADHAVIRSNEGPFTPLDRAPLDREGWTYGVYGGLGSLQSAAGDTDTGPAFTVQIGYFPEQRFGVLFSQAVGWRQNRVNATMYESRSTLELQALPVQLGIFHAGVYGGIGGAYRLEDSISHGNEGSSAFTLGGMFQLDINTRIALTARLGTAFAHGEHMNDVIVGLSVY